MKRQTLLALALLATGAFAHGNDHAADGDAAKATGHAGDAREVDRVVALKMDDRMRFTPATITVARGETVKFVVRNEGRVPHEMVLGNAEELRAHAVQMRAAPHMSHADPNAVQAAPGQSAELVWQFTQAGEVSFACLLPGHYEAGMAGKVVVR